MAPPVHAAPLSMMLAAIAQSKKDQIRYDELVNHKGVYDDRHLKLKAHSKTLRQQQKAAFLYFS